MKAIRLREGKERSLLRRHPWVFAGSVEKGKADAGETVRVESHDGRFLAWASFSPSSQIRVRAWSFDEAERIDAAFFQRRIAQAVAMRERLAIASDAWRLVHGEADGLPGLVVDRYGDTLVAQFGSAGAERWKAVIADALLAQTGLTRLYERSDAQAREWEGLPAQTGWRVMGRGDGVTWLELKPQTGRTHQLRVHCQAMGWPILGDPIYGDGKITGDMLHLHARGIIVPLYKNKPAIAVEAPPSPHMLHRLALCGYKS
jgi:23S rRNA (cytosine1962-C5)-methyltransferase